MHARWTKKIWSHIWLHIWLHVLIKDTHCSDYITHCSDYITHCFAKQKRYWMEKRSNRWVLANFSVDLCRHWPWLPFILLPLIFAAIDFCCHWSLLPFIFVTIDLCCHWSLLPWIFAAPLPSPDTCPIASFSALPLPYIYICTYAHSLFADRSLPLSLCVCMRRCVCVYVCVKVCVLFSLLVFGVKEAILFHDCKH